MQNQRAAWHCILYRQTQEKPVIPFGEYMWFSISTYCYCGNCEKFELNVTTIEVTLTHPCSPGLPRCVKPSWFAADLLLGSV